MAKEVAAQLTSAQLDNYGNIILNGYLEVGPNSTGKLAWQYKETASAPVPLPNSTSVRPALKGWTTNYMSYFTRPEAGYSLYPGQENPFQFDVWNWVNGVPQYSQCPRRFYQNQVLPTDQGPAVNNPAAIQYSFMYPVQTIPTPPPIDYVAP
jgi:hypothetical protein